MNRLTLAAETTADLKEIWEFIARDHPQAADRWIERLFDNFEALRKQPGMGHRRRDLTRSPLLFWPVERYLILYRYSGDHIQIVAVTEGSRDIPILLSQRLG